MNGRLGRRTWERVAARPSLTLSIAGVGAVIVGVVQNVRAPHLGRFDPDQAAYLTSALRFARADGLPGLMSQLAGSGWVAPLVPLASLPLIVVAGRSTVVALMVQPVLYVGTAMVVAAVATRLSDRRAGLVCGIVALGLPVNIVLSQSYLLALGSSFFLALALWALLSSDRGRRPWLMFAFGVALGLMLLSRIMVAAFVPGVAIASLVIIDRSRRSFVNLGIAVVSCIMVAGPWWLANGSVIADYVSDWGYGRSADALGPASPIARFLLLIVGSVLWIRPLLLVPVAIVAVSVIARLGRRWSVRRSGGTVPPWTDAQRGLVAVSTVIVVGIAALATSANMGNLFTYPVLALIPAVVVGAGAQIGGSSMARIAVVGVCIALANVVLVSSWWVHEDSPAVDVNRLFFSGIEIPADADGWARADVSVAVAVDGLRSGRTASQTVVGETLRTSASSIGLAQEVTGRISGPIVGYVSDARGRPSVDPWDGSHPRIIVAIQSAPSTQLIGPSSGPTLRAATRAGWVQRRRIAIPDGGRIVILTHPASLP